MNKINNITYDEWFKKIANLITDYNINKKIEKDDQLLKQHWENGEAPAVALQFMFPEYYRF